MSADTAPPPVDEKAAALAELRRRAGTDQTKLAALDELERRYKASQSPAAASAAPTPTQGTPQPSGSTGEPQAGVSEEPTPEQRQAMEAFAGLGAVKPPAYLPPENMSGTNIEQVSKDIYREKKRRDQERVYQTPLIGPTAQLGHELEGVLKGSNSVDEALAKGFSAAGSAAALPFSTALSLVPKPVQEIVQKPFSLIDEYIAAPLGEATGSQAVRQGVNVLGGTAAAVGAVKGLGRGIGYGLDKATLNDLPKPSGPPTGGVVERAGPLRDLPPAAVQAPPAEIPGIPLEPAGPTSSTTPAAFEPVVKTPKAKVKPGETPTATFPVAKQQAPLGYTNAELGGKGVIPPDGGFRDTADMAREAEASRIMRERTPPADYTKTDQQIAAQEAQKAAEQAAFDAEMRSSPPRTPPDLEAETRLAAPSPPDLETYPGVPSKPSPKAPTGGYTTPAGLAGAYDFAYQMGQKYGPDVRAALVKSFNESAMLAADVAAKMAPADLERFYALNAGSTNREGFLERAGGPPRLRPPQRPLGGSQIDLEAVGGTTGTPRGSERAGGPPRGPTELSSVREPAPPPLEKRTLGGEIKAAFSEKIGRLKSQFNSPDLFYKTKDVLDRSAAEASKPQEDIHQFKKEMTSQERSDLTPQFMEGQGTGTPAQEQFRTWWKGFQEQLRQRINRSGVRIVDPKTGEPRELYENPNYFPQDLRNGPLDRASDNYDPKLYEQYVSKIVKEDGVTPDQAREQLNSYSSPGLRSYHAGSETARTRIFPYELRNPDVFDTMETHIDAAIRNAVEHEVFKYRDASGKPVNVDAEGRPQGLLGDYLNEIQQRTGRGEEAKRLVLDVLGRDTGKPRSSKIASAVSQANAVRLYGFRPTTAIVQATTNVMTYAAAGGVNLAKGLADTLKDPSGAYERAVRAGVIRRGQMFADTVNAGDTLHEKTGAAVTNAALSWMNSTDASGRVIASETAPHYAQDLQTKLNGTPRQAKIATVALEQMDYSPEAIQGFKTGDVDMDVFRQRFAERTQGKVTNASRMSMASTPLGQMLFAGKNFSIQAARNSWRIAGDQMFQAKNPTPAIRMAVAGTAVGYGVKKLRDILSGESKFRTDDLLSYAQQGAAGGIIMDAADAAAHGDKEFIQFVDRLSNAQFMDLLKGVYTLGSHQVSPPAGKSIHVEGMSIPTKEGRMKALADSVKKISPSSREWSNIFNRISNMNSSPVDLETVK